jgi:hypothetical protein
MIILLIVWLTAITCLLINYIIIVEGSVKTPVSKESLTSTMEEAKSKIAAKEELLCIEAQRKARIKIQRGCIAASKEGECYYETSLPRGFSAYHDNAKELALEFIRSVPGLQDCKLTYCKVRGYWPTVTVSWAE